MMSTPYSSDDSDLDDAASSSMRRHLDVSSTKADPDVLAPIVDRALASRRVHYYHSPIIGSFSYGYGHPMKPQRMRMAHSLITAYGLDQCMTVREPKEADKIDMSRFHTDEYVDFLERVTPENGMALTGQGSRFLIGEDCPPFPSVFQFCSLSSGGSISAATSLNSGAADIAINWAGGLHHAKKREASGFCYTNDIVLGILELLKVHPRVLYIDVDIHHGDGVEEAFYATNRVLTLSFHKFGDFFPGTGDVRDVGIGEGKGYAVNVPLRDGVGDDDYQGKLFRPVIKHIMDWYRPGAVVLQCGADSLAGDKLGCFNLSMRGHAACVSFLQSFNVPLMCVGGGGYTVRNVARTWTYETALLLGREPDEDLPFNEYMNWFGPEYKLDVRPTSMENLNSDAYLEGLRSRVIDNLRSLPFAPSVQTHQVPKYAMNAHAEGDLTDEEEQGALEKRISNRINQASIQQRLQYPPSDSESEMEEDDPCGAVPLKRTQSNTSSRSQPPMLWSGNSALDAASRHRNGLYEREGSAMSSSSKLGKRWLSMGYTPSGGYSSSSFGSGPPEALRRILASSKALAAMHGGSVSGRGARRRAPRAEYDSDAEDSADDRSMMDDDEDRARRQGEDDAEFEGGTVADDEDRAGDDEASEYGGTDYTKAPVRDGDESAVLVNGHAGTAAILNGTTNGRTRTGRPKRSFFDTAKPYQRPLAFAKPPPQAQPPPSTIQPDALEQQDLSALEMERGRRGEGGGSENVEHLLGGTTVESGVAGATTGGDTSGLLVDPQIARTNGVGTDRTDTVDAEMKDA